MRIRVAAALCAVVLGVPVTVPPPAAQAAAAQPGQPVVMASGAFVVADDFHKGEGRALLVRLPDGRRFIRFENFRVTNGPDLYVYLSGHPAPRTREQLHQGGAVEVALLKGNVGNQNYELPATLDVGKFKSVVIYCKRFSVLFASATLDSRP
jgi:hypothetical protein